MNIVYPGRGHAARTNLGNHGDRFTAGWYYQKPWPCRAFEELRMKAAEIADLSFGSHKYCIDLGVMHCLLGERGALFEFSCVESAFCRATHD